MKSPICEHAVEDSVKTGTAILKFISPNDVDVTGAHQAGYYLPKAIWHKFTPYPPEKGQNKDHPVEVFWPDGRVTASVVKWYGKGTRSEYRLTRFGRDFPWRTADNLGSLLVLIPKTLTQFVAYVLELDEDIEEIQAALGIEVLDSWVLYEKGLTKYQTEDDCLDAEFRVFAAEIDHFPEVRVFSDATRVAILNCIAGFGKLNSDEKLIRFVREEYELYKMVERKVRQPEVERLFSSIDDFLDTAQKILQARKSRAGRSLENHVEYLLKQAGIPFQMRQVVDGTRPDIIIPSKARYEDASFPTKRLFMIGIKTTCKDRWRQVTKEAPRIKRKHILTLQKGISAKQLEEIHRSRVSLIVPESLHKEYPPEFRPSLLTVQSFIDTLRSALSHG
jgi:type II restriction enzyme